jgi:malate dehydrogenase (oxaloacetate-decarboxylating)
MSSSSRTTDKNDASKKKATPSARKTAAKSSTQTKRAASSAKRAPKPAKQDYNKRALSLHKKLKGKLRVASTHPLETLDDWSTLYSPGVGAVAAHLYKAPSDVRTYTTKRNSVAVVSDGSAVLGLGNVGPTAALPVMEGKAAIFKEVADIDAWPIVLDTQEIEGIVQAVKAIAPGFGGINLEDIAAPRCFEVEERLKAELDIPVMHDDQHGTAIVVLAGLINSAQVVEKRLEKLRVVIVGAGAAGRAITLLLREAGIQEIIVTDSLGAIHTDRPGLEGYKKDLATVTNLNKISGDVMTVVDGADAIIGVSGPGTIAPAHIERMAPQPIVFALANPIPEIMPDDAARAGAAVVATGRSDHPNQINNSLVFPGIFRGALDRGVRDITSSMKLAAAQKLAKCVKKPTAEQIIPSVQDPAVAKAITRAVKHVEV